MYHPFNNYYDYIYSRQNVDPNTFYDQNQPSGDQTLAISNNNQTGLIHPSNNYQQRNNYMQQTIQQKKIVKLITS